MEQHKETLVKYSIEKAEQALETAFNSIDSDLLNAQNRAYYAVFYIILALGYIEGFTTGKHQQLMGWFNKKYIYEDKIFDNSFSKIYSRLYVNRQKFDYDVTEYPEKEETRKNLNEAKYFVETVREYIIKKSENE
jgi:uncharacterized protein (UPF0332 family)